MFEGNIGMGSHEIAECRGRVDEGGVHRVVFAEAIREEGLPHHLGEVLVVDEHFGELVLTRDVTRVSCKLKGDGARRLTPSYPDDGHPKLATRPVFSKQGPSAIVLIGKHPGAPRMLSDCCPKRPREVLASFSAIMAHERVDELRHGKLCRRTPAKVDRFDESRLEQRLAQTFVDGSNDLVGSKYLQ